ncbi:MAG: hypothetical protein ACE15C_07560 [Phycisphaerae bacterium]
MGLDKVRIGAVEVTRLAIGGNPFSGFSHQGSQRDRAMRKYYTVGRIKEALHKAEAAGINTFFGRTDNHVVRMLEEYWDEGGKIQWIAQTASEVEDFIRSINVAGGAAKGCYLHGGQSDVYFRNQQWDNFRKALARMRELKLAAGFAAHRPEVHEWIRDNTDPDFQLTCYYDPSPRIDKPDHVPTDSEKFDDAHRDRVARMIGTLKASAVHYKVLAAGRKRPEDAFAYVANVIRPRDVVLVGFYLGDDPDMIAKTVKLFEQIVQPRLARVPAGAK